MKRFFLLTLVVLPLLVSCQSRSIANYSVEIEDTIRGELATAQFIYNRPMSDLDKGINIIGSLLSHLGYPVLADITDLLKSDNLGNELYLLHEEQGYSYFEALTKIANSTSSPFSEAAGQMLDIYQKIDVSIGNVSLTKNTSSVKQWHLIEVNSNISFFFILTGLDTSTPCYQCFADKDDFERYISDIQKDYLDSTNNISGGHFDVSSDSVESSNVQCGHHQNI